MAKRMEGDKKWRGYNVALGKSNEIREFTVTKGAMCSSFLTPLKKEIVHHTEPVKIRRIDDVIPDIDNFPEHPVIFLKADTQGFDIEVIKGASSILENIICLQSEISVEPLYESMPHYLEALQYYEALNFELVGLFEVAKREDRVVEYDCIMTRKDRHETLQPEKGHYGCAPDRS